MVVVSPGHMEVLQEETVLQRVTIVKGLLCKPCHKGAIETMEVLL